MALNYDNISASVRNDYIPNVKDAIFESSALLAMLVKDGREISAAGKMTTSSSGGQKIIQPLMYAKSTAVGTYSNYDVVDISPQEFLTAAEYQMKNYYVSVTISHDEQLKVAGDDLKVIDLMNTKMEQAKSSLKDKIGTDLYTGTGSSGLIGLDTAIDSAGTYGAIDSDTYTWWRSTKDTTAHTRANMVDSTNTSYLPTLLANGWKASKHKNEPPNLIVCSQDVWDIAEEINDTFQRFNKPTSSRSQMIAQMGFSTIEFRGIPMIVDDFIDDASDPMYMLNDEYLTLYYHPQNNFDFTGFKESTNQPNSKTGQITVTMQLAISNRRHFYRWTDLNN